MKKFVKKCIKQLTEEVVYDIINRITEIEEFDLMHKSNLGGKKNNMNVETLANSLINLYITTRIEDERINCTRTKVGKMLTIVQIIWVKRHGEFAFEDAIVEESCGTSVPVLPVMGYPYEIWGEKIDYLNNAQVALECNKRIDINSTKIVEEVIPSKYIVREKLCEEMNNLIRDVFFEFALYEGYELGLLINEFKSQICVNGEVSLNNVRTWLQKVHMYKANPVVDFIINH